MQLKKLQLVGFKTFAEKTEIEIGGGLTAVVGPNGSGKSNIADALLWVLGEQSPRLLRGSDSRDVIFAGTDRRKPVGMAEVKLTVDNTDRSLPIEFAEVTVTRRIYRSGESQYLLNNSPCRLKDIVELFLDTGVGKGAYGFVSQNEIDAVLSARPEDRRELFEEAAGIKKYRVKKREAVRKLDNAEANLTRIRDIIHELEQQREPLAKQAEEARRYLILTERLQKIEVDLLIAEIKKADYELYAARQDRTMDEQAIAGIDADAARLERESESVGEQLAVAEREAEVARIAQQAAHTSVERTESQLQLAVQRGANAEQSTDQLDADIKDLAERAAALNRQIEAGATSLEKIRESERRASTELASAKSRLAELEAALAEAMRHSEDRQGLLRRLTEQRAQRESALAACQTRLSEVSDRIQQTDQAAAESTALIDEQQNLTNALISRVESLRRQAERQAASRTAFSEAVRQTRDKESELRTGMDAASRLLAERSTRLATLTELQETGEGFYQGVRAVLAANREGKLAGFHVPAVDLMTVPERLRTAIEIAMGGSVQDVVCETEAQARAAIDWLKQHRAGRATFLALSMLRPAAAVDASRLDGLPRILGVASELIQIEDRYRKVAQLLLGRVVVAEDMESAISASRKVQGWSRIVTIAGELLTPGGALTGGSIQGKGAHLIGRKGEIDDLHRALPALRSQVEQLSSELQSTSERLKSFQADAADADSKLAEIQSELARTESESSAACRDLDRLKGAREEQLAEKTRLTQAKESLTAEEAKWQAAVAEAQSEDSSVDDAMEAAQQEARRLQLVRDESRNAVTALEVQAGRLSEQGAAAEKALNSLRDNLVQTESARAVRQLQRELAASQFSDAQSQQTELERRLNSGRVHLEECELHLQEWRDRRQALLNDNFERTNALKSLAQRRSELLQDMHDAELRIARLEVKIAHIAQRLSDEYGMSLDEAVAAPDMGDLDRDTVNEIARLRREIRSMGQVNTGAVEEYDRLTERHDFLAGQRADLDQARESLMETIKEIDESTRDIFMETFDAVSAEFGRIFDRLFGGGTTKLVLTTPDDLLETGIDVIAQPPGKKPQHLSLLSGGERALTAIALLFSFLAVRPSPFCLLDEVDAPLDGPNVEKFVDLVSEFAKETQFIVITHNPTTMESAPRWYGVTMQEPGISRILSYKVPDEAVVSSTADAVLVG